MHQNAPLPDKKMKRSGDSPLPRPFPYPTGVSTSSGAFDASILAPEALGVPVLFHLPIEHCCKLHFDNFSLNEDDDDDNNNNNLKESKTSLICCMK